jgi:hypothetical protein
MGLSKGGTMRKALVSLTLAGSLFGLLAGPALADVSTTQQLPAAACNQGTMNAHENVPETTGSGKTTPGHAAIPGTANVVPCGHGG